MDCLDYPDADNWEERHKWFEQVLEEKQGQGSYLVSEQACALSIDLQGSFCAGAWVAVIILALAIIDAHLREVEIPRFPGNTAKLIEEAGLTTNLDWLRKRRNKLIHIQPDNPAITVDDQWLKRDKLEDDARKAIELVFDVMFQCPGV